MSTKTWEHNEEECQCRACVEYRMQRAVGMSNGYGRRAINYDARDRPRESEPWDARPSRLQQAQELRHQAAKLREEADQKERVAAEIESFEARLDAEYGEMHA
jgi:hypothetical protein